MTRQSSSAERHPTRLTLALPQSELGLPECKQTLAAPLRYTSSLQQDSCREQPLKVTVRLGVTWVKADGFAVGGLCFRVSIHNREQVPKVVMRVGVAWVEADGFAVGGLCVYVAVLAAKTVPRVSVLLRLGGGCDLARGGAGLAGSVGERVQDSLGAGAPGGVLGQKRLKQVTQRAGVLWRGRGARQDGCHQRGQGGSVERRCALHGGV